MDVERAQIVGASVRRKRSWEAHGGDTRQGPGPRGPCISDGKTAVRESFLGEDLRTSWSNAGAPGTVRPDWLDVRGSHSPWARSHLQVGPRARCGRRTGFDVGGGRGRRTCDRCADVPMGLRPERGGHRLCTDEVRAQNRSIGRMRESRPTAIEGPDSVRGSPSSPAAAACSNMADVSSLPVEVSSTVALDEVLMVEGPFVVRQHSPGALGRSGVEFSRFT